jgi:hypothetical protein
MNTQAAGVETTQPFVCGKLNTSSSTECPSLTLYVEP